jgi:8-oxo-dGTP pyrophosphatase MutT (NUDIX family)
MNQYLKDKTYIIPPDVLKVIEIAKASSPDGNGIKRANYLLKNGVVTYHVLKRLKNFFDHFDANTEDKNQHALAGGELMRSFVERTLNANRDAVRRSKTARAMPYQTPRLTEAKAEKKKEIVKNAIAIIVDKDNKILLLKRADVKNGWGNNQYGLVGGGIEKNETPQQAVEREIEEETGLKIKKFHKTFKIQRNPNTIEYVFACRYSGEPIDVTLNDEHVNYGWYDISEIIYLDTVPNLKEYITLSFTKY